MENLMHPHRVTVGRLPSGPSRLTEENNGRAAVIINTDRYRDYLLANVNKNDAENEWFQRVGFMCYTANVPVVPKSLY